MSFLCYTILTFSLGKLKSLTIAFSKVSYVLNEDIIGRCLNNKREKI